MPYSPDEMLALAQEIQGDHRRAQAKLTELARMIATLPAAEDSAVSVRCPDCGPLPSVRNEEQLREHRENVHGFVPDWPSDSPTTLATS